MKRSQNTSIARVSLITSVLILSLYYMFYTVHAEITKKDKLSINHLTEVKLENLTFKMKFKKQDLSPGESPEVLLEISNNSGKAEKCSIEISINATRKASPMMRMMPFPRKVWSKTMDISLSANEKKELTLKSDYKNIVKETLSISIIADGKKLTPDLRILNNQLSISEIKQVPQKAK